MAADDQKLDEDQETLVAYLDGELNEADTVEVEKRLASCDKFRGTLNGLERTWNMLDELPSVEPTEAFTRSTLEMAIGDQVETVLRRRSNYLTIPLRVALMVGIPLLACLGTYAYATWRAQAPVRSLIADMPLLTNYELYESAKTIEFAKLLSEYGLFSENFLTDEPAEFIWDGSQETLESLSDERKADLQRKLDRFGQLPEPTQQAFREFHAEMLAMENRDELMEKLRLYDAWLQEISRDKMLELQSMPAEERVVEIRKIERAMRRSMFGNNLNESDKEIVFLWFEELANSNQKLIRNRFKNLKESSRRFNWVNPDIAAEDLLRILINYQLASVQSLVTDEKFEELYQALGPRARRMIDDKEKRNRKQFVLLLNSQPYVSDSNLRLFYQTELTAEQHEQLDKLSPTELKDRLVRIYIEHRYKKHSRNEK